MWIKMAFENNIFCKRKQFITKHIYFILPMNISNSCRIVKLLKYKREFSCGLLPNGTDFIIRWIISLNDPEFTTAFLLGFLLQNIIVTGNVQEDVPSNFKKILITKLKYY
jgi:hypothetical protein